MLKLTIRRFIILIPQLLVLSILLFILASFMPGDALTGQIDPNNSPERIEELRIMYGFYDPWYVKYERWVKKAVVGDFGQSIHHKIPVTRLIGQRAVNTLFLSLLTTILMYLIAVPLGLFAGRYQDKLLDKGIVLYSYIALAMPSVVMSLINMYFFIFVLKWFPFGGSVDVQTIKGSFAYYISRFHHMILPAISGAVISTTSTIHYLRSEIIDYKSSDFVLTAKSKGVPNNKIFSKHVFRNAIIPTASSFGYSISGLLAGSILIERVFSYPGMGTLFIESIMYRDFATVNALVMLYAFLGMLGGLLSDILLSVADPRIRIK